MFLRKLLTLQRAHNSRPAIVAAVNSRLCLICHSRHIANRAKSKHLSKPGRQMKGQKGVQATVTAPTFVELFQPATVEPNIDSKENDLGEELAGKLSKESIAKSLTMFRMDKAVLSQAESQKITGHVLEKSMQGFIRYCLKSNPLPPALHIVLKDIDNNSGHVTDLLPFYLDHSRQMFPHIECIDELTQISDLTDPTNWYPMARSMERKIIFHAGPTNSGKTYHALKAFMEAGTGVYCGPLRLLAMEVYDKANNQGVPCDLVTGETRKFALEDETPANHISCTVEMLKTDTDYDVAVVDEIQMIGDLQRGSSWTRALLGIAAREIHVCGEETAIDLVEKLTYMTGSDTFEVRRYERLTKLEYLDKAVVSLDNLRDGDCIVCFRTLDIFNLLNKLRARNVKAAVIYGNLPPGTKIKQAAQFNDEASDCNILLATDAVGMGLNLSIKRMIFYSVMKIGLRPDGLKTMMPLTTSQALQIAGRAGRFRTRFQDGEVTTYFQKDIGVLKKIVGQERPKVTKAGLTPTVDMIESFSYLLPHASLSNLLDIFVYVATMNESYFMCHLEDMKALAQVLQDIPMSMRSKFTFCVAPLKVKEGFPRIMYKKMAKLLSEGQSLNFAWLYKNLRAPFKPPRTIAELQHLQAVFNVIDIYLWLSFRFAMFDDIEQVQDLRVEVDTMIQAYLRFLNSNKGEDERRLEDILPKASFTDNPLRQYQSAPKKRPSQEIMDALFGEFKQTDVRSGGQADPKAVVQADPKAVAQADPKAGGQVDPKAGGQANPKAGRQADRKAVVQAFRNAKAQAYKQHVFSKSETNALSIPQIPSFFKDVVWTPPSSEDDEMIVIQSTSKPPGVSRNLETIQTSTNTESFTSTVNQMEPSAELIKPIDDIEDFTGQFEIPSTPSSTPKVINFWSESELQPDAYVTDQTVFEDTGDVISDDSAIEDTIIDDSDTIEDDIDEHLKSKLIREKEFPIQLEPSELNEDFCEESDTDFVRAFKRAKLEQMKSLSNTSSQTDSELEKHGKVAQKLLTKKVLSPRILEALQKEWEKEKEKQNN